MLRATTTTPSPSCPWASAVGHKLRQAAQADPAFAAEYRKVLNQRARTFAQFIDDLNGGLAPGIDARTATDLLWALSNEELYRELVVERGWSLDRYERWLAITLVAQLLRASASLRQVFSAELG
jgi:hypothetical protein